MKLKRARLIHTKPYFCNFYNRLIKAFPRSWWQETIWLSWQEDHERIQPTIHYEKQLYNVNESELSNSCSGLFSFTFMNLFWLQICCKWTSYWLWRENIWKIKKFQGMALVVYMRCSRQYQFSRKENCGLDTYLQSWRILLYLRKVKLYNNVSSLVSAIICLSNYNDVYWPCL